MRIVILFILSCFASAVGAEHPAINKFMEKHGKLAERIDFDEVNIYVEDAYSYCAYCDTNHTLKIYEKSEEPRHRCIIDSNGSLLMYRIYKSELSAGHSYADTGANVVSTTVPTNIDTTVRDILADLNLSIPPSCEPVKVTHFDQNIVRVDYWKREPSGLLNPYREISVRYHSKSNEFIYFWNSTEKYTIDEPDGDIGAAAAKALADDYMSERKARLYDMPKKIPKLDQNGALISIPGEVGQIEEIELTNREMAYSYIATEKKYVLPDKNLDSYIWDDYDPERFPLFTDHNQIYVEKYVTKLINNEHVTDYLAKKPRYYLRQAYEVKYKYSWYSEEFPLPPIGPEHDTTVYIDVEHGHILGFVGDIYHTYKIEEKP